MPRSTGDQPPNVARSAPLGGSQTLIISPAAHRSGPTGLHHALAGVVSPRSRPHSPAHHRARRPAGPHHHASAPISPPHEPSQRSRAPCPPAHHHHHRPNGPPAGPPPPTGRPALPTTTPNPVGSLGPGPPGPPRGGKGRRARPRQPHPHPGGEAGGGCWFSACGIDFSDERPRCWAMMGPLLPERLPELDFLNCFAGGWDWNWSAPVRSWRSNANQIGR